MQCDLDGGRSHAVQDELWPIIASLAAHSHILFHFAMCKTHKGLSGGQWGPLCLQTRYRCCSSAIFPPLSAAPPAYVAVPKESQSWALARPLVMSQESPGIPDLCFGGLQGVSVSQLPWAGQGRMAEDRLLPSEVWPSPEFLEKRLQLAGLLFQIFFFHVF